MLAPRVRLIAALALSGVLGCTHQPTAPPPPAAPPSASAAAPAPPGPAAKLSPAPGATGAPSPAPSPPAPAQSPPARAAAAPAAHAPAPKHPAPASTAPGAAASPAAAAPPAAAPPAPTALNLASLEERLRDTHAIGVFTKLSLKNQVDDLLGQFRAFYAGQGRVTLPGLRRSYELLLMKVVTLLQDDDPGLASSVSSSREAIWAILSDRNRFNSL